ncbi:ATP synthase F(0) complex subunit B1, mitochondrial [Paecilomyces lecythidis]|uniref:ATP synthase F(0) complex subunit B1, mitochondrial n=1 Tax=Paecilomyces lecythidis TaxID=3004212 RepID=A0ABR3XUA9_9EURO
MPLKDVLHKKDKINEKTDHANNAVAATPVSPSAPPEFRFYRTDTNNQEVIQPPAFEEDAGNRHTDEKRNSSQRRLSIFRRPSTRSPSLSPSASPTRTKGERRLSSLLHLDGRRSRSTSSTSINVPADLPQIDTDVGDKQDREAQWEKRATILVQGNPSLSPSSRPSSFLSDQGPRDDGRPRSSSSARINDPEGDVNILEAIRLHESGDLARSTQMFGTLADPNGANNALSQVLYGLALRHGWGCEPDPAKAVTYLSAAASNSASIEAQALEAGMKKGGAAKGELVLAIFELANCFRNGWGVTKDPVAARQYYETAANLGDTDAMNEAAWCYLEGFGGKKDKYMAAKYYRLAEENGSKTVGNSW